MIDFILTAATYVAIQSVLSLGLNLQWGLTGLLNLAYILFMAVGAYVSAVVISPPATPPGTEYIFGWNAPFALGVVAGVVATTLVALLVGSIALRNLRADYFAIVTLVIAAGLQQIAGQFRGLFNGSAGLIAIPQPLETTLFDRSYAFFFLALCGVIAVACYVFAELLRRSPFGRALRALREDETAAAAFGRNPYTLKLKVFVIGGALAGLGGTLLSTYVTAFAPAGWGLGETLLILVCLFVGGSGNNAGAVLGTALVIGLLGQLPQILPVSITNPDLIPDLRFMVLGLLIILFLRWRPEGLLPERPTRMLTRAIPRNAGSR